MLGLHGRLLTPGVMGVLVKFHGDRWQARERGAVHEIHWTYAPEGPTETRRFGRSEDLLWHRNGA